MYPNQPPAQSGWPAQPPPYTARGGGQPGYDLGSPVPARRRRRRSGWVIGLITLAVLVVLAVIADQVGRVVAQNAIASKLQSSSGTSVKPSVSIEGFPFLTQVAAHDLRVVDISASNVPAGKVTVTSVKAKATGVHLSSGFNSATIDQVNGTALISFASLEKALGVQGAATIGPDPADGPNALKLSAGSIGAITGRVEVTGPNQVTLRMESLSGLGSLLGGAVPVSTQTFQIPKLPAGLVLRSVSVTGQGVVGTASAQHTTLSQ